MRKEGFRGTLLCSPRPSPRLRREDGGRIVWGVPAGAPDAGRRPRTFGPGTADAEKPKDRFQATAGWFLQALVAGSRASCGLKVK